MGTNNTGDERHFFASEVFRGGTRRVRVVTGQSIREPARDVPVFKTTDVLVVGGGPAGTAAAVAAARLGADVTLVERYNHLGGLSTGGLVIWIDRMTDWDGREVIQGLAKELMDRLPSDAIAGPARTDWGSRDAQTASYWAQRTAAFHGIVTWSPTIDPEWLKTVSQRIVLEHQVDLLYHAWIVAPIVEGNTLRGAIFESKAGRQAILAKVVVDTTGDGDLYALAGAPFETDINDSDIHHCINTSWLFGGVDMTQWIAFRSGRPDDFAAFMDLGRKTLQLFDKPFVSWRNDVALFMGPRLAGYSPLDVDDLTTVEIRSREMMMDHLAFYRRHAPGFEHAFLMLCAPQIGARHSRRLVGVKKVLRSQWDEAFTHDDEIGVSPGVAPKFKNISVPYGALVPTRLDGILAAGKHVSCDRNSHAFLREIPQCWLTGQAAGAAAALAADQGVAPRAVDIKALQQALVKQGVFINARVKQKVDVSVV
jgi:hypothetical protein